LGVNSLAVAGTFSADPVTGSIELSSRDALPNLAGAQITPAPRIVLLDPQMPGCDEMRPTPTNTPSMTATPSATPTLNTPPTLTMTASVTATSSLRPSPSATPTSPTPQPGDANCDGKITATDLAALSEVLFVPASALSCPYADANQDGRVSAADLTETLARIGRQAP
jgi:hypothetical protein